MARVTGGRQRRAEPREPDAGLALVSEVGSRYVLHLRDRAEPATVLRVLDELGIPLGYLLLLPAGDAGQLTAYVGLAAHDVADLPIRFASQGLHLERGEELPAGDPLCSGASTDAPPRAGPSRRPGRRKGGGPARGKRR